MLTFRSFVQFNIGPEIGHHLCVFARVTGIHAWPAYRNILEPAYVGTRGYALSALGVDPQHRATAVRHTLITTAFVVNQIAFVS